MAVNLEIIKAKAARLYTFRSGYRDVFRNGVLPLFDELLQDFKDTCGRLDTNSPLSRIAMQIEAEIEKLVAIETARGKAYHRDVYFQLCEVLYRCQLTLSKNNTQENMQALSQLPSELPGHVGTGWKILSVLLFLLSATAMMVGFLMVLPSGGTSLLMTYVAYMGLTALISSASALITASATTVALAIGHGVTASAVVGTVGIGGGAMLGLLANGLFWDSGLSKPVATFYQQIAAGAARGALRALPVEEEFDAPDDLGL